MEIGVNSLVSNILCKWHNSLLSPVDRAGISAFDTFAEIRRLSDVRSKLDRSWSVVKYQVDGNDLERWFAKCTINLFHVTGRNRTWWWNGKPRQTPPEPLVRFVFGLDRISEPMGLYAAAAKGEPVLYSANVNFAPVYTSTDELVAGLFDFRGFKFLMWLYQKPPDLQLFDKTQDWRSFSNVLRHIMAIRFQVGEKDSQRLEFLWK